MVQCGVDALVAGVDGPRLRELAGLDPQELSSDAMAGLFRAAAKEVGVVLPDADVEARWGSRVARQLEEAFPDLPKRSRDECFQDDVLIIAEDLALLAADGHDAALGDFAEHVLHGRVGLGGYDAWLDQLERLSVRACRGLSGERARGKVAGVTDLILSTSYGSPSEDDLERIRSIRQL